MENTYGEFQGTDLDPNLDFDFDDEENDLVPILGLAAALAAVVGAMLLLMGRRKKPSATERAQELVSQASKSGKKGLKMASKAVEDARLGDLLEEALDKARHATYDGSLEDILKQARKQAKEARKGAMRMAGSIDLEDIAHKGAKAAASIELASLLQDAIDKTKEVSSRIEMPDMGDARKRAAKIISNGHAPDIDAEKAVRVLDDLKEKLLAAVEAVRGDIAPKAMDTLKSSVIPGAQDAVDRLREDVFPAAQERVSHLAQGEVAQQAQKAATAVKSGTGSLSQLLQTVGLAILDKIIQDILPEAKKTGAKAIKKAQEDVIPTAASAAGDAAQKVREQVLPRVGEAAAQTPGMLNDVLQMARDKVAEAMDKAAPVMSDAAETGKQKAGDMAEFSRHRAGDMAEFGRHRADDVASGLRKGKPGVTKNVSAAGKGVGGAVGGALSATTHATREFTGILFWLSMLGALILLVFVPEREKQQEFWNNTRMFLGEVREMWRDLQGPDYDMGAKGETPV